MDVVIYDDRPLGKPPKATNISTSKTMKANKGKDTKPELLLRKALRESGYPGYRLHWKSVPGRPDISYPGRKTAVFVHGCFWHRCPHCNLPLPKSNIEYWLRKFGKNKKRDKEKEENLYELGWKVFTFWECMIRDNSADCAKTVVQFLSQK